jgi:hypothetical protein
MKFKRGDIVRDTRFTNDRVRVVSSVNDFNRVFCCAIEEGELFTCTGAYNENNLEPFQLTSISKRLALTLALGFGTEIYRKHFGVDYIDDKIHGGELKRREDGRSVRLKNLDDTCWSTAPVKSTVSVIIEGKQVELSKESIKALKSALEDL